MTETKFVDIFTVLINESTRPEPILAKPIHKNDYAINLDLCVMDRDEAAIKQVTEEINNMLKETNRDEAFSDKFQALSKKSKQLHEQMKKVGEVQLVINPQNLKKTVRVFKEDQLVETFTFNEGDMLEGFFQYMKTFNEELSNEYC